MLLWLSLPVLLLLRLVMNSRHAVQALHHRVPAGWDEQHREGGNQLARSARMEHLSVWSRLTLRRFRW